MKDSEIEKLLEIFVESAKNHYKSSLEGNWKVANKEANTIKKVYKRLITYGNSAREALLALTDSEVSSVSGMAALYSLKYAPDKSISTLMRLTKEPGLIGFEAQQALNRWEEGEWRLE